MGNDGIGVPGKPISENRCDILVLENESASHSAAVPITFIEFVRRQKFMDHPKTGQVHDVAGYVPVSHHFRKRM
ncbi:hypothetical protein D3C80_1385300 [compost metagenome]